MRKMKRDEIKWAMTRRRARPSAIPCSFQGLKSNFVCVLREPFAAQDELKLPSPIDEEKGARLASVLRARGRRALQRHRKDGEMNSPVQRRARKSSMPASLKAAATDALEAFALGTAFVRFVQNKAVPLRGFPAC